MRGVRLWCHLKYKSSLTINLSLHIFLNDPGLHFTEALLRQLQAAPKRITPCYLTLHVVCMHACMRTSIRSSHHHPSCTHTITSFGCGHAHTHTHTQGAGTFQPVAGEDVGAHAMHWERVSVPLSTLEEVHTYTYIHPYLSSIDSTDPSPHQPHPHPPRNNNHNS